MVQTLDGSKSIKDIQLGEKVVCWDEVGHIFTERSVTAKIAYKVSELALLRAVDVHIYVDNEQAFLVPKTNTWHTIAEFQTNQQLLGRKGQIVFVDTILNFPADAVVYDLVVDGLHNFCVGLDGIVAHNFVITIPIFLFGFGEVVFASGVLEVLAAGGVSALTYSIIKGITGAQEEGAGYLPEFIDFDIFDQRYPFGEPEIFGSIHFNDTKSDEPKKPDPNGAQAPGMPAAEDGFFPPKNWDGLKQPHPKNGKYGWPDKKGRIWVPTGPKGHRGPHWDRQYPNGSYDNVLPGGKVVGGNN